jgi:adenylate cyclase class 2
MATEIEAKLKVESLQEIERKLNELGAEFLEEQLQKDYYFDDSAGSLFDSDRCLRLRRQTSAGDEKIVLTYKGAKETGNFKKRRELEVEVSDADSAGQLLSALGYEKALVVEKKRRLWRLGRCGIGLDELPLLGSFIEIEGPDDKTITDVQSSLGVTALPHIAESYAHLVAEKQKSSL